MIHKGTCRECGGVVEVEIPDQPGEECPIETMDIMSKWLTCEPCLRKLGRSEHHAPKQQALPMRAPAPEPRQGEARHVSEIGLPYKDE